MAGSTNDLHDYQSNRSVERASTCPEDTDLILLVVCVVLKMVSVLPFCPLD